MSRPTSGAPPRRLRLWLIGALVLCLFPLAPRLVRPLREQLQLPVTPVDRTDGRRAREWLFLDSCRPYVPPGARFTVIADEPHAEMSLFMMAIGLFPESRPLPHSHFLVPALVQAARAKYVLEYRRSTPADPGARLVARVADGAVYERSVPP